ncbi:MAG: 2-oxo acid dehydrogenase subunit E2 [Armatimonadota bacterium]|jgi:pyruvate dehydrogenase E2 component (dihydrolipoamide acetyltransferase)|nr:2-oxo acid dehydrogenase subunit E2 [Fimbriimonadaceae bacterium]
MAQESLRIPMIGEGLQEARVVAFLKQPGDFVKRDEPIYQMETDKAVMDVESPFEGTLVAWTAKVDDVLPIGEQVGLLDVAGAGASAAPAAATPEAPAAPATSSAANEIHLRIPMIGEGLQEARLVKKLKQPGDTIRRDEAIYQMETDKAVMDVESPHAGTLVRWLAEEDQVLPIGAEVLVMTTDEVVSDAPVGHAPAPATIAAAPSAAPAAATGGARRRDVPPRTRAHAKAKGLSDDQIEALPVTGKPLMPADVDAFLAGGAPSAAPTASASANQGNRKYQEKPFEGKQRILASRLQRGNQLVVPGMMSVVANWGPLESLRAEIKARGDEFAPSAFTYFAYAVARAAAQHPISRSTLVGDHTVRTYDHVNLGIAVALPGDELVVAVVDNADTLDWKSFAGQARDSINQARDGRDQAHEGVTVSLTNMQAYNIREAMAVVVPPGVATIFLGEPYNGLANDGPEIKLQRCVNVGITIDHRLINGVGGAEFLNAIKNELEAVLDWAK